MTVQVKVSSRVPNPNGEGTIDLGTVKVRVQRKAHVSVFNDGATTTQEQWQDQDIRTLANEEGMFQLSAGQRLILEE